MVINRTVATPEMAVEYITNALANGELHMKEACKELGWSFPRIRSRAHTIARKMKCAFMKTSRGVYILEPLETPTSVEDSAEVVSDTSIEGGTKDDDEYTLDADEVEAALLGNNDSTPNV